MPCSDKVHNFIVCQECERQKAPHPNLTPAETVSLAPTTVGHWALAWCPPLPVTPPGL